MRAAVATPPPTRIDVEELISGDARRRRHRAWTFAGTGVAAAVAAVLVTPAILAGEGNGPGPSAVGPPRSVSTATAAPGLCTGVTPKPTGPEPPLQSHDTVRDRPTEPPTTAAARLSAVLGAVLEAELPDDIVVESVQPSCSRPQFQYHPRYRHYEAVGDLQRGTSSGWFMVTVDASPASDEASCAYAPDERTCEVLDQPDGSVAVVSSTPLGEGVVQATVSVFRPDGTVVQLMASNGRVTRDGNEHVTTRTAEELLLTTAQMVTIGRTAGLTLYP
ncbi:hypothetical protein D7223_09375 [Micromonospora endolithica]|uniref:Uncharacterized protein n=2 Tax=Micromonospora endolithica TaxID=230091 RepID=A0A3A9ZIS0_9ACTN|nr:hypothetical protein D7223_09375 [Micromonospora endolithica]